jgi:ornithine cyclodeaminase/alanine dehydrogenase-like protein (mu-crystallin family)
MKKLQMLYLSRKDIEEIDISMEEIIVAIEKMFELKGRGLVEMPPKPGIHPKEESFIHAMPAYIPDMKSAGMKWVSGDSDNTKKNLPYTTGLIILNDPETCIPICVMDATWITGKRTGAANAVAAKYLARKDSETIGIIGCGVQGESNLEALMIVQKNIKKVFAHDTFSNKCNDYISKMERIYPNIEFKCVDEPREVVQNSDIIVTATRLLKNPKKIIEPEWFQEGAFGAPVDYDCYWKDEVFDLADKFCTDDVAQLLHTKEQMHYFQKINRIHGDLGEIVIGKVVGRENDKERIICSNLGMALSDVSTGIIVYHKAIEMNIGKWLEL